MEIKMMKYEISLEKRCLLWNPMDKQKVTLEGDPTGTGGTEKA